VPRWPWSKRPVIFQWDDEFRLISDLVPKSGTPDPFTYPLPPNAYGRILQLQYNFTSGLTAGTRHMLIQLNHNNIPTRSSTIPNGTTASRTQHYIWDQIQPVSTTLFGLETFIMQPLPLDWLFLPGDWLDIRLSGWFIDDVAISFQLTYNMRELY